MNGAIPASDRLAALRRSGRALRDLLAVEAERLRGDRPRLAAIAILALIGGLTVAGLLARGETSGADARAYWAAVRIWLNGGSPYQPEGPFLPYVYPPWMLPLFAPWALLPWDVAWFFWRGAQLVLLAWTLHWAYRRRPLATALAYLVVAFPIAANLDTGNITLLLALMLWGAQFAGPRTAGALWAVATWMKWVPAPLLLVLTRAGRRWGLGILGLFALLSLLTLPLTVAQLQALFGFGPRPLRLDYLVLLWAVVPWWWRRPRPLVLPIPAAWLAQARRIRAAAARWVEARRGDPQDRMARSIRSVLAGTLALRLSTSLTGTMLIYYLADLPAHGGSEVQPLELGLLAAAFYVAELVLAPPFGVASDRLGHHRVMQWGPAFGLVAVVLTWATTNLVLLGGTRFLEGASTAASVPSILGFIAAVTASSVVARGRVVARFEAVTLIGLGLGIVIAGPLFQLLGRTAFLVNAAGYLFAFLVYRFGVDAPEAEVHQVPADHVGFRRYWRVLTSSHVWLLAPTWIAINACLGIVTNQSLFQLVKDPGDRFPGQVLMGSVSPVAISLALGVAGLVFFAGLFWSGGRFVGRRRTTMIFEGVVGGLAITAAAVVANRGASLGELGGLGLGAVALLGVFLLAGATPAALGLLADISETYPTDRGAIMGLYSVFLALGQILGSLAGGAAAQVAGIDGLVGASAALLILALVPLHRLRDYEHVVGTAAAGHGRRTDA